MRRFATFFHYASRLSNSRDSIRIYKGEISILPLELSVIMFGPTAITEATSSKLLNGRDDGFRVFLVRIKNDPTSNRPSNRRKNWIC